MCALQVNQKTMIDVHRVENDIAAVLLQIIASNIYDEKTSDHIEHLFLQLFNYAWKMGTYVPPAPILESLAILGETQNPLSSQAIDYLIFLGALSPDMWLEVITPQLIKSIPTIGRNIMYAIAGASSSIHLWNKTLSKNCTDSLVRLCDIDKFEEGLVLSMYPSTPFVLSFNAFKSHLKEKGCPVDCAQCEIFEMVLKKHPSDAWEPVSDRDIIVLFEMFDIKKIPPSSLTRRIQCGFQKNTPAFRKLVNLASLDNAPPWLKSWKVEQKVETQITELDRNDHSLMSEKDATNSDTAFAQVQNFLENEQEEKIKTLVGVWLKSGREDLVAAAYIAAPNALNRMLSSNKDVMEKVSSSPMHLWSTIDDELDIAISELLRGLPEIGALVPGGGDAFAKDPSIVIRRYSLLFPYLWVRRISCLRAVVITILSGLTERNLVYEKKVLQVLETILKIIESFHLKTEENIPITCTEVLRFLLSENRETNGIPENLEKLVLLSCKILSQCPNVPNTSEVKSMAHNIQNTTCNSINVKESAGLILSSFR